MEYRTLGRTGVQVSRLCFGTMSFGGDADEATSAAMFRRCRDAGINFFDCADVYQAGRSEEILGRAMADGRDELVITTKVHFPMGPDVNQRGLSRTPLCRPWRAASAGWQPIASTSSSSTAATPRRRSTRPCAPWMTCATGKVLYLGVSNWAAWQFAKALGLSALHHLARFDASSPCPGLVKRQAEWTSCRWRYPNRWGSSPTARWAAAC